MAEISSLLTLQGQLALLTLIGFFLARKGIINAQGRKCLTDLLINVILPANIIQSFLVEFSWDVLKSSASILVISLALQIGCVVLCALGYNWLPFAKRSVYQYGTVCSNGAFLGSALVDGIWGSSGLLLSSIYLIPQRVAMWSVGVSYFLQDEKPASKEEMRADRRAVLRKTFTHPCILAVVVGMVLMASQLPLPGFLGRTVKSLSNCNMGVSMILIGAIIGSSLRRLSGVSNRVGLLRKKFFSSMINKMQKPPPKKINPAMPMTSPNVPCGCTMTSRQESAAMIAAASVVPSNLRWLG